MSNIINFKNKKNIKDLKDVFTKAIQNIDCCDCPIRDFCLECNRAKQCDCEDVCKEYLKLY